jgi:hypothetical protein
VPGDYLDVTDDSQKRPAGYESRPVSGRRFVGIHFLCCDVYTRVYLNRGETAYEGNCPKCAKRVQLRIGPDGTNARFFTAE